MIVNFGDPWIGFEFVLLGDHLESVEELMAKEAVNIRTNIEKEASKITDPRERDEFCAFYGDDLWKYQEHFPQIQRAANLIVIMSRVETKLNSLCTHSAKKKGITINLKDFRGKGISRAKDCFSKTFLIRKPWNTRHWSNIKMAAGIRNEIVHNEGIIQKQKIEKYVIANLEHFSIDMGTKSLKINKTYFKQLLEDIHAVFNVLIEELKLSGNY